MGENIDDFIKRFGGSDAVSDDQAQQAEAYYKKFSSQDQQDEDFKNQDLHKGAVEYLGKLPDDQFQQTATKAYSEMEPQQQESVVTSLLGALQKAGVNVGALTGMLGMQSTDPQTMAPDDYARLANYTRREHPEAMEQVIADKPMWLKALGNPVVIGALGMIASKWLQRKQQDKTDQ